MRALGQGLRFGLVGGAATAGHALSFALLIEAFGWPASIANLAAFAGAVLLSFAGHHYWTFASARGQRRPLPALGRFTLAAAGGLGLNSLFAWTIADRLGWHYGYALVLMITVTPAALFVCGKFWAFAPPRELSPGPAPARAAGCPSPARS